MKASHYIKEVKKSEPYKNFISEDPKAYLCSVFFVRDFLGNHNDTQVDFYSPNKKAIVSFKIEPGKKIERVPIEKKTITLTHKRFIPKPLDENTLKMDIDEIKPTIMDEMHNREMVYEIEKILASLNFVDDRAVWNCTAFLRGLGLLQAHIEDQSKSILFMEKKSLLDLMKFSPINPMPDFEKTKSESSGESDITMISLDDLKELEKQIQKQADKVKKADKEKKIKEVKKK
ncbi:MAG: hypothetical protein QXD05_01935 [Candidatus Pacearchaeota archaeon]